MKVVRPDNSLDRGVCQNSDVKNTFEAFSLASMSPTDGRGKRLHITRAFIALKSTQTRTEPFGLMTGTMGPQQSVSVSIRMIIFSVFMRFSLLQTLLHDKYCDAPRNGIAVGVGCSVITHNTSGQDHRACIQSMDMSRPVNG